MLMPLPVSLLCLLRLFQKTCTVTSRFRHNYSEAVLIFRPIENTLYWRLGKKKTDQELKIEILAVQLLGKVCKDLKSSGLNLLPVELLVTFSTVLDFNGRKEFHLMDVCCGFTRYWNLLLSKRLQWIFGLKTCC